MIFRPFLCLTTSYVNIYYFNLCRTSPILLNLRTSTEVAEFARLSELIDCLPSDSANSSVAHPDRKLEAHWSLGRGRSGRLITPIETQDEKFCVSWRQPRHSRRSMSSILNSFRQFHREATDFTHSPLAARFSHDTLTVQMSSGCSSYLLVRLLGHGPF